MKYCQIVLKLILTFVFNRRSYVVIVTLAPDRVVSEEGGHGVRHVDGERLLVDDDVALGSILRISFGRNFQEKLFSVIQPSYDRQNCRITKLETFLVHR
jgi:hypothetical protein